MSVLLLNANHEPMQVISDQHAVGMMLRNVVYKAPVAKDRVIPTSSEPFLLPNVLCLKEYHNVPRIVRWSKSRVLIRDNYTCIYCGATIGSIQGGTRLRRDDFSVEHIQPQSRGGKDTWGNTACACKPCNSRKGDRFPHELGMKLLWEPKRPRTSYLVAHFANTDSIPQEWKMYIELKGK